MARRRIRTGGRARPASPACAPKGRRRSRAVPCVRASPAIAAGGCGFCEGFAPGSGRSDRYRPCIPRFRTATLRRIRPTSPGIPPGTALGTAPGPLRPGCAWAALRAGESRAGRCAAGIGINARPVAPPLPGFGQAAGLRRTAPRRPDGRPGAIGSHPEARAGAAAGPLRLVRTALGIHVHRRGRDPLRAGGRPPTSDGSANPGRARQSPAPSCIQNCRPNRETGEGHALAQGSGQHTIAGPAIAGLSGGLDCLDPGRGAPVPERPCIACQVDGPAQPPAPPPRRDFARSG